MRVPIEAVLAALAGSLAGGALAGAHLGDTTKLHGCQADGGRLRLVEPSQTCPAGETVVDWAITGPAGSAGATGDAGAAGDRGVAGAVGPAGAPGPAYRLRVAGALTPGSGSTEPSGTVTCAAGERAIAGGMAELIGLRAIRPLVSQPTPDGRGWTFTAVGGYPRAPQPIRLSLAAVCAKPVAP